MRTLGARLASFRLQFFHRVRAYDPHAYLYSRASANGDIIKLVGVKQISIIALALQRCFEIIRPRVSRCSDSRSADRTTDVRIAGASPIADKGTPVERRGRKTSGPRGDLPG